MQEAEPDTETLVRQACAGNVASVAALMQRHRSRLRRMVCARMDPRVSSRVDPSDVIQDALTNASRQLPQYLQTRPIPFYPWLRRIAWQTLVRTHEVHLDAAKRSVSKEQRGYWAISDQSASGFALHIQGSQSTPSVAAVRKENRQQVRDALAALSEIDREVLVQRYVEQLTIKDIAAGLCMTEAAVQMRHMRALRKMHQLLAGDAE